MADQMTRTLEEMGHEPTRLVAGARRRERPNRLNLENSLAVLTEGVTIARAARSTRCDVVWLHTFGVPTLPAIRTLAQVLAVRAMRKPIIVELHAFALAEHVATAGRVLRSTLWVIGRMSRRVVVLQEADERALRGQVAPEKVSVLPNWVDVPSDPQPLPAGPPFTALFVGGLVRRKGVPELIEAMRLLGDVPVRLRVVGGAGDDGVEAADAIRRGAADLMASGVVEFLGQLDDLAVRRELTCAHLFVLPSRAEGMPLSMIEALAEGRSVVVGDAGNMADIVRETGCGAVLSSQEPAVIAEALRRAVADPGQLAEGGRRGHEAAVGRFSGAAAAAKVSDILNSARQ